MKDTNLKMRKQFVMLYLLNVSSLCNRLIVDVSFSFFSSLSLSLLFSLTFDSFDRFFHLKLSELNCFRDVIETLIGDSDFLVVPLFQQMCDKFFQ